MDRERGPMLDEKRWREAGWMHRGEENREREREREQKAGGKEEIQEVAGW